MLFALFLSALFHVRALQGEIVFERLLVSEALHSALLTPGGNDGLAITAKGIFAGIQLLEGGLQPT